MLNSKKCPLTVICILFACVLLPACGGGSSSGGSAGSSSALRFFHASPDSPPLDVYFGETIRASNLSYRNNTGFISVNLETDPGQTILSFNPSGTSSLLSSLVVELTEGETFTVIVTNLLSTIETLLVPDDLIAPGDGLIKFRAVHASPTAPALDLYLSGPDEDLDFLTPVFEGISFKSVSDFLQVERGEYRIRLTVAGTKVVAIDSNNVNLDGERIFTIVALESESGGEPFSLEVIRDNPR